MTKIRLKPAPNFKKWSSSYIYCVKEDLGDPEYADDTVQYTLGFTMSPEARQLGGEYQALSYAIRKEDGRFLEDFFASPGLKEMRSQEDDFIPNEINELHRFYSGERWGFVYDFLIETFKDGDEGYINAHHEKYFYYLPEYPFLLADALTLFNTFSFENTTHVIRLHQMWNRLREIRNLAFTFDDAIPGIDKESDEKYSKFFISTDKVHLCAVSEKKTNKLIKLINSFQNDYKVKKDDYFQDLAELKKDDRRLASDYKNAFEAYLGGILNSYAYHLEEGKILKSCHFCGNVFKFVKNKLFCSEKDGNNCGQKARNKRFYKKNRNELLPKARASTRQLRQFYKDRGIKK